MKGILDESATGEVVCSKTLILHLVADNHPTIQDLAGQVKMTLLDPHVLSESANKKFRVVRYTEKDSRQSVTVYHMSETDGRNYSYEDVFTAAHFNLGGGSEQADWALNVDTVRFVRPKKSRDSVGGDLETEWGKLRTLWQEALSGITFEVYDPIDHLGHGVI